MFVISVKNVNKFYSEKVHALQSISFSVKKGEIFGVVGPDGAGKTTLFNIMTTLLFADSGQIKLLDMDIETDYKRVRQKIGYLPGNFSLYPDLTVEENLSFFAGMYQSSLKDNMSIILPIWKQLVPFKKRRAGKLSGGMKQKLALSCALVHRPEILFLDEPTTGVDPVSRCEFWEILKNIQKQDITVVVSTPYMDEASRCDRIALIQEGKIIQIDTPLQIVENFRGKLYSVKSNPIFDLLKLMKTCPLYCKFYPYGEYLHLAFYEGDEDKNLERYTQWLRENQVSCQEIKPIIPSIEDCFIELMRE
jgi:ABC-type multidrug transport system ATPase subunit